MANYNLLKSPAEDYFRGQAKRFGITLPNQRRSVPNKRTQANIPSYISRQSSSRLVSDSVPHGQWYKPSKKSIEAEKNALAEYDWNKHIQNTHCFQKVNLKSYQMCEYPTYGMNLYMTITIVISLNIQKQIDIAGLEMNIFI